MKKYIIALLILAAPIFVFAESEIKTLTVKTFISNSNEKPPREIEIQAKIQIERLNSLLKLGWKVKEAKTIEYDNYIIVVYTLEKK